MRTRPQLSSLLVIAAVIGSCQSVDDQETRPEPASSESASSESASANEPRVRVTGAQATVEDDGSITLNYPKNDDVNYRVPEWVINPATGGVTGAVGAAPRSLLGAREQLDQARWNGRLELASMLELRVQRIARSELEEDRRVSGDGDQSVARRDTLGIDKEILDAVLAGTRQRALWWDTETGELFVWMVMDGAVRTRADQRVVQGVSVFTANAPLPGEYRPKRAQPKPPKVVVDLPQQEQQEEPAAPATPVEKLEDALKPIETIPSSEEGTDG